jgi:trehalose synthase
VRWFDIARPPPDQPVVSPVLQHVPLIPRSLDESRGIVGPTVVGEVRALAAPVRGARVAQVNATAYRGGVSELLHSLIPLYLGLDIAADWLVIPGSREFFRITKRIHNALQGARIKLSQRERNTYMEHNWVIAGLLDPGYDFVAIRDPQPAAVRSFVGGDGARWVWRCHIDTSHPNTRGLEFIMPLVRQIT